MSNELFKKSIIKWLNYNVLPGRMCTAQYPLGLLRHVEMVSIRPVQYSSVIFAFETLVFTSTIIIVYRLQFKELYKLIQQFNLN